MNMILQYYITPFETIFIAYPKFLFCPSALRFFFVPVYLPCIINLCCKINIYRIVTSCQNNKIFIFTLTWYEIDLSSNFLQVVYKLFTFGR